MQQGSEEWKQARCGRVTASRVHDIVAVTRSGGYTSGRKNYLAELVCERLTGQPALTFQSAAMAYGTECEPEARFAYALAKGVEIEEVGFIPHPTIDMAGASPDGLVAPDGLVEIKCPNTATHIETLLGATRGGGLMPGYADQMQFQMSCTGRQWCDFVSYDKRLPEPMQMSIYRLKRDDEAIAKLELEVTQFLIDLDATVDLLRKRYMQEAA
jgi:putative phage-type endonuclease